MYTHVCTMYMYMYMYMHFSRNYLQVSCVLPFHIHVCMYSPDRMYINTWDSATHDEQTQYTWLAKWCVLTILTAHANTHFAAFLQQTKDEFGIYNFLQRPSTPLNKLEAWTTNTCKHIVSPCRLNFKCLPFCFPANNKPSVSICGFFNNSFSLSNLCSILK